MQQLFISHAVDTDGPFAQRLAADLNRAGLDVWIAPQSIGLGESFPSAINRGLSHSSHFLLVVSPAALSSPWVSLETDAAIDLEQGEKLHVIPIVAQRGALPPLLRTRQSVLFQNRYEDGFCELLTLLGISRGTQSDVVAHQQIALPQVADADTPRDTFTEGALIDLDRAARVHGYLMLAAQPVQESIVQAVVEDKNAIRIGISIDTDASMNVNALLAMMSRELSTNPHQIAGVLAMQQNDETRMQIYQLGGGTIRDAMHLQWNEIHGREPLGQALDWFYEELKGRRHTTSP